MKLLRDILVLVAFIIAAAVYFIYNTTGSNADREADYSLSLATMQEEFLANEVLAFEKYFNQVVEISGTAASIIEKEGKKYDFVLQASNITANGEVVNHSAELTSMVNQEVLLKGVFINYDKELKEIRLSDCSVKNQN